MPLTKDLAKFSTASPISATFTSNEIISGLGLIEFQGYQTTNSSTTDYHLSTNAFWSDGGQITTQNTSNTSSYNFDTAPFEFARTISGDIVISFTHAIFASAAGGGKTNTVTVAVYHYDGSTETLIGTQTSQQVTSSADSLRAATEIMQFTATDTLVRQGEQIRVKVTMAWSGGGGNYVHYFANSPQNLSPSYYALELDTTENPTYFKVNIPFRIDE